MIAAAKSGNFADLLQLLSQGFDANEIGSNGWTPLHFACSYGNKMAVKALLKARANVNVRTSYDNKTALHCTLTEQVDDSTGREIIRLLTAAGADVNFRCNVGADLTALHLAARLGRSDMAAELIGAGAQLDSRDFIHDSPLYRASEFGRQDIVRSLIAAGADLDSRINGGFAPLHVAIEHGRDDIVQVLLEAGADTDVAGDSGLKPLHLAVFNGRSSVLDLLVEAQADVNCSCTSALLHLTPLHIAAALKRSDLVEKLIRAGASVDKSIAGNLTALHAAVLSGDEASCRFLMQHGAKVTTNYFLLAMTAAFANKRNHVGVMKLLSDREIAIAAIKKNSVSILGLPETSLEPGSEAEIEASNSMSAAMRTAGFNSTNAAVQAAAAAQLQKFERRVRAPNQMFVFGSFSDGWGSCLTALDGRIDDDSDIDVTFIESNPTFCIKGFCKLEKCPGLKVEYEDGHVRHKIDAAGPNAEIVSILATTAVDFIRAHRCCCYPTIELLQPGYHTNISPEILKELIREVFESPYCHVVSAASPGLEESSMRVSTTLLERTVMHHLTTVQGQLFILLKYLIKKVLNHQIQGLKTYIAKNILFFMLDKTPPTEWKPEKLLDLTRQSLQMLKPMMQESGKENVCMPHFFIRDAAVYFKRDQDSKPEMQQFIKRVIDNLPEVMNAFQQNLQPQNSSTIYFQPFQQPALWIDFPTSKSLEVDKLQRNIRYDESYDFVKLIVIKLNKLNGNDQLDELLRVIDMIPDHAKTARECLTAMAHMKCGTNLSDAVSCITETELIRGIPCPQDGSDMSSDEAESLVSNYLTRTDSAWKFVFFLGFDHELDFKFLPEAVRVVLRPIYQLGYWHMNFRALAKSLKSNSPWPVIEDLWEEFGDDVVAAFLGSVLGIVALFASLVAVDRSGEVRDSRSTGDRADQLPNFTADDVD